ncbi:MAG: copper transporter [Armatimonadetes bacterium]|nr:copper transporter [Armatimonadota bacterium]
MIDIRHHIYSLAAVFLALAIGMVIGTSFDSDPTTSASGRRTIQRYETDMRKLKDEIIKATQTKEERTTALRQCQEYCRAIMPMAISGKLEWRNIALVQTGDYDDLTGSVKQTLEMAGARITCVADINGDFDFSDDEKVSQALATTGLTATGNAKADREKLFRVLADTVSSGKRAYMAANLEKAEVAVFTGACDQQAKMVVILGGASSDERNLSLVVDSQLPAALQKFGVTVVGCETSSAVLSYVPGWHKAGIATVDNADNAIGQTCLVYALGGEMANFGTKETADRLIPKSLGSI